MEDPKQLMIIIWNVCMVMFGKSIAVWTITCIDVQRVVLLYCAFIALLTYCTHYVYNVSMCVSIVLQRRLHWY